MSAAAAAAAAAALSHQRMMMSPLPFDRVSLYRHFWQTISQFHLRFYSYVCR